MKSIVRVKLKFGKQIARGDAKKHAGRDRQDATDHLFIGTAEREQAGVEEQSSHGHGKGVPDVDEMPMFDRTPRDGHERAEREGVERLVQRDDEKNRQPGPGEILMRTPLGRHAGGERDAVEQAMQPEAEEGGAPTDRLRVAVAMSMIVPMSMTVFMSMSGVSVIVVSMFLRTVMLVIAGMRRGFGFGRIGRGVVMMEMKRPLDEEHHQEAGEREPHRAIDRADEHEGVRHEMQDPDAEHRSGDEAQRGLHPRVREPNPMWDEPAEQRSADDAQAVDGEK